MSYSLDNIAKTFELQFQINKQKKGLILGINNIKKFNTFRIRFKHLIDSDYVLFNLFLCDKFAQPCHSLNQFKRSIVVPRVFNHDTVSASQEQSAGYAEVGF
jgi:hypothetical protein